MEQRYQLQEEPAPLSEPLTDLASEQHLGSEEGASSETAVDKNAALEATRLTALLHREARIRQKETLVVMAWAAVFFFGMLGIVNRLSSGDSTTFFDTVRLCVGWMIALGLAISVHIGRRSYRRKQALTQALKEIRDVQQVGPLVQALRVENTPVRNLAKRALIDLLPQLQTSDSELLGDSERAILLRQLAISPADTGYRDLTELFSRAAYRREVEFRLAILKAMEQVGGARELPVVERLARGQTNLLSQHRVPDDVRDAAAECLPYLQSRAHAQRASEQLLRASSAHDGAGGTLLRPSNTGSETAPEQMLRASAPQNAPTTGSTP